MIGSEEQRVFQNKKEKEKLQEGA